MGRLRSCPYCGRIHPVDLDCGRKPVTEKHTRADGFRSSGKWQKKREEIRKRDYHLCRWHLAQGVLVYENLSVHHIRPLHLHWEGRLEDSNLITLCSCCHERAEKGLIPQKRLEVLALTPPGEGVGKFEKSSTPTPTPCL